MGDPVQWVLDTLREREAVCRACGGSGHRNGSLRAADPFGTCPGCDGTGVQDRDAAHQFPTLSLLDAERVARGEHGRGRAEAAAEIADWLRDEDPHVADRRERIGQQVEQRYGGTT